MGQDAVEAGAHIAARRRVGPEHQPRDLPDLPTPVRRFGELEFRGTASRRGPGVLEGVPSRSGHPIRCGVVRDEQFQPHFGNVPGSRGQGVEGHPLPPGGHIGCGSLAAGHGHSCGQSLEQGPGALAVQRVNRHHRAAERGLKRGPRPDGGGGFVDHDKRGQAQVEHLEGQIEVALEVGTVEDEDQSVRPVLMAGIEQGVPGDGFVERLGVKAVRAGQVHQLDVGIGLEHRHRGRHGHARQVGHLGLGPGQEVEQRGFPAIGVADECEFHRAIHGSGLRGALPFASQISRWARGPSPRSITVPMACPVRTSSPADTATLPRLA